MGPEMYPLSQVCCNKGDAQYGMPKKGAMEKLEHTKTSCCEDSCSDTLMDDRRRRRLTADKIMGVTSRKDFVQQRAWYIQCGYSFWGVEHTSHNIRSAFQSHL